MYFRWQYGFVWEFIAYFGCYKQKFIVIKKIQFTALFSNMQTRIIQQLNFPLLSIIWAYFSEKLMLSTAGTWSCLGFNMIPGPDQTNFCTCFSVVLFLLSLFLLFQLLITRKYFVWLSVFNLLLQSFSLTVPVVNLGQYSIQIHLGIFIPGYQLS